MLAFLSIGRHSYREQETFLDPALASLLVATCLNEIRSAGHVPAGIVSFWGTDVSMHEHLGLPMTTFAHEDRLRCEASSINRLLDEQNSATASSHVLILRPGIGWTPAPRIEQLVQAASGHSQCCVSLLKQDAMQHIGWNMQVQARSRLVDGALIWPQSPLFSPKPLREEHPEIWKNLQWPAGFPGSQHLPDVQYYDETMLAVPVQALAEGAVPTGEALLKTARFIAYDEEAQVGRPIHEHLRVHRMNSTMHCDMHFIKDMLRLHLESLSPGRSKMAAHAEPIKECDILPGWNAAEKACNYADKKLCG